MTPVEMVRLLIRDNGVMVPQEFIDAEVQGFLDIVDQNVLLAAALALKAWAAKLSGTPGSYKTTDGKSVDKRDMVRAKMDLAANYEKLAESKADPAIAIADSPYVVDDVGQDFTGLLTWDDVSP